MPIALFRKLVVYFLIIFFWICVISMVLFIPHVSKKLASQKSITILTFPRLLDAEYVSAFTKKTGIKLYVNYYENNDELIVKMRETKGRDYDIVIPSDYAVEMFIKEGLLQPIDKSKVPFLHTIKPHFLGHYFDPHNDYSIPILWDVSGIGINKKFFKEKLPKPSWKLVFDEHVAPYSIGMINNAREIILVAAYYLFGSIDHLTPDRIKQIKELLLKQKKWVEVYTDLRSDYLLAARISPVVAGMASEMWPAMRFDASLDFLVPSEGTFMVIDSVVISAQSKKKDLVYSFINYLYKPEVLTHHHNKYSTFPVTNNVSMRQEDRETVDNILKKIKKVDFFRNVLTEEQLDDIWIDLKAS